MVRQEPSAVNKAVEPGLHEVLEKSRKNIPYKLPLISQRSIFLPLQNHPWLHSRHGNEAAAWQHPFNLLSKGRILQEG